MDTLDILKKAQNLGGPERREAMTQAFLTARDLGCTIKVGGGRAGGFNVRYGAINYAVMDMNTRGEVFLHIKPHPNKPLPEDRKARANAFVQTLEGITIKNAPIHHYGQAEELIEDIPAVSLAEFLEWAVETIRDEYYTPHLSAP